jgi:RNase P subunit RPR2
VRVIETIASPGEEPNMRQQSSFSTHFDKISNSFARRFYCANCESERLMMISAIASAIGRDNVIYQCTDCGTEQSEPARTYRVQIGRRSAAR